jgi:hypothetical protein
MANACALPVAVAGALMPDAHVGYGLPIGGVLATDNAVIPYAVGVDIACRMKLTVYDRKANTLAGQRDRLANLIESETRFGMGCELQAAPRARRDGRRLVGLARDEANCATRRGRNSARAEAAITSSSSAPSRLTQKSTILSRELMWRCCRTAAAVGRARRCAIITAKSRSGNFLICPAN